MIEQQDTCHMLRCTNSLSCHFPGMLKVVKKHQLVIFALVVVTCEVTLHTTRDDITVFVRVGIPLTELKEVFKIMIFRLYNKADKHINLDRAREDFFYLEK